MPSGEFTYSVGHVENDHEQRFGRLNFPRGQKLYRRCWDAVVTDLADDYRHQHDGWEARWPLEFRIYEDDIEQARFSVECEFEPVFHAWQLETPPLEGIADLVASDGEGETGEASKPTEPNTSKSPQPTGGTL